MKRGETIEREVVYFVMGLEEDGYKEVLKAMYEAHYEGEWKLGFERFKKTWGKLYPEVVKSWERDMDNLTSYLKYPYALRRFIYTTNSLKRLIKEVKRRTKAIEVFPSIYPLRRLFIM